MSLNPNIRDQAYQFFIEEAQELLQVLEDGLLSLQEDHSTPKVHELMRAAHSIKGGAASVELDAIKTLAHRLEDFFKALYSEKVIFDDQLEGLLLQAYDCLRNPLTEQMEMGSFDEGNAIATADPIFSQLEGILGEALEESDSYIPGANDLGIDIVASIFEVDVAQSLDTLSEVIENYQNFDVSQELQNQIEVLGGFAELFALPGFTQIIELTKLALQNNPDQALDIAQALLHDCRITRDLVLDGDRSQGGEPSSALLALAESNSSSGVGETTTDQWLDPLNGDIFALDDVFGGTLGSPESEVLPLPNDEENIFADIGEPLSVESESDDSSSEAVEQDFGLDLFASVPPAIDIPDSPATEDTEENQQQQVASESDIVADINLDPDSLNDVFGGLIENSALDFPDFPPVVAEKTQPAEDITPQEANQFPAPENLESAVESIGEIFEQLPVLEAKAPQKSVQITPVETPKSKTKESQKASGSNLSVRVDLDRLERMNNLVGELVINRNSLSLQNEQLQSNIGELTHKFTRFRKITAKLREFSDQMLVESERSEPNQSSRELEKVEENSNLSEPNTFDSLEMDSYSNLHLILQEILDEVLQLEESMDDIFLFAQQSDKTINSQRQMLGQMRDELMWARMLPLEQILKRFPRTLRDLSSKYKKPVNLEMFGTGVLVDKAVLEKLYDPLLHLFRNGFDHGIEPPEIRRQQGKPEKGKIEIHAYYQGNQTVIDIKDDGQGLNLDKIAEKALKKGLISPEQIPHTSEEDLFGLIFEPGFSTAEQVSEISGRGVGMSVVRSQIESLKGTITVSSVPGEGSTFSLRLPLTLTIAKLLVFSLGITAFAIPSDSIEEIIIPLAEQIKVSGGQRLFYWNNTLIPICDLKGMLPYNCTIPPINHSSKLFDSVTAPQDWELPLLLIRRGQKLFALEIEKLVTEQELVIKPFGKAMSAPNYTYGCTILGDGTLIPVLNGATLLDDFLGITQSSGSISSALQTRPETGLEARDLDQDSQLIGSIDSIAQAIKTRSKIMIIDDSTALRRTMALSLQNQGYQVVQAKDGQDAMKQLRQQLEVDLIVCDVEMPNMNGFEFLDVRRRDTSLAQIPVIMLTSRSGQKHRNLAKQLGANAYFTKPYIEQEFLKELSKILTPKPTQNNKPSSTIPLTSAPKTILVIDDSSTMRRTLTFNLEHKGYQVLQAKDGQEGLDKMKQNSQIDLVICDIEMPNVNGFEFLSLRRKNNKFKQIPVAMLTSRSGDKHRNLAKQLGANSYFTKPYVEEQFIAQIEKLIASKLAVK
ncbi:MAG: hybrid sensor histidine kinase/response regulator [Xenococcaceae cyanobacterium MO_188.B19]|nr:hybrid sensor histidine kinase/response regulator [Xenococcaceae cyanobacterium MO_188.B19]